MGANPWGRAAIPGGSAQRARILQRDPICRCSGCPRCSERGCTRPSTQDDHIVPLCQGGNADANDDRNHAGMCVPCHAHKSRQEAAKARWAIRERRPAETHPGLRN